MNTHIRKRRPAGQRALSVSSTVEGAFEEGKSEIEALKEEICDWRDNLESNSMDHLPKYDEVSECADALESAMDAFETAEFPSCISDVPANYTKDTRQAAGSRFGRMSNAQNALDAARSAAEQWLDDNPELTFWEPEEQEDIDMGPGDNESRDQSEVDQRETDRSEVEAFIEQLDEGVSGLENVGFPGMY